ncbi:hypothetical protein MPSEU_000293700 [Mayamaea pseudoterrestris]|nr:hypothetical protein MPSEU_000293700 [Mayamaea pseudoterrestris]
MASPTSDEPHTGDSRGAFARVAQEILDTAERVTTTVENGIQGLFSATTNMASNNEGNVGGQQGHLMDEDASNEFSQQDYDAMVREQLEGSPLQGMAEQVLGGILQGQNGPTTFKEQVDAFRYAINWTEPLLTSIIGFQVVMFLLTLWVSRRGRSMEVRLILMVLVGALVKGAQRLNSYGAQHWEKVATQNYFDQGGIFMTILVCAPLLVDCFIMLACFLREAASLLVQVKTAEIKKKRKQDKAGAANNKKKNS